MEDIFEGISLEELAGGETVVDPIASGMKQGDGEQKAENATETAGTEKEQSEDDEGFDPDAIDLKELANQGAATATEEEDDDNITSSQTPTDDKGTSPSSKNTDATTSLVSALAEVGVFSSLTDEEVGEIKSAKDLVAAVRRQTEENKYSDLTETQQSYLDALKEGIPEREFHENASNVAQYQDVTPSQIEGNPKLVTELIRRSLVIKGVDNATATEMAEIQASKRDASARGATARQSLIDHEQGLLRGKIDAGKASRDQKVEDEKEALITLKAKIQQSDEVLPGVKVNSQTKNKIFNSMTTSVREDESGQPLNEVMSKYEEDPEFRYKLHAMYQVTKGFTDFKKFKNAATSAAVEALEEKLQSGSNTRTGSASNGGSGGRTAKEIAGSLPSTFGR